MRFINCYVCGLPAEYLGEQPHSVHGKVLLFRCILGHEKLYVHEIRSSTTTNETT